MMKKAMFNKFTNFLQHAVETFVPNVVPQEEFVYHWKSVTSYFVDNKDAGARIEETALPEHLTSMLRIIQEEESDLGEAGTTGVCLEYLLQHRLLETLYTLGRTDHPPGMKQIVLSFFTKLLSRISHPLLPHINVHRAVQRLVKACGETKAAPTEKEEIEFLCTVCAKIKMDPYLVNFFIENSRSSVERAATSAPRPPAAFSLVEALLALSQSEDARVSLKACEGLMLCASLPEQSAATALISHTQFCSSVSDTLCQLYDKLPTSVYPEDVEGVEAKWGFDNVIERNEQSSFAGKRHVIFFLSWLDYTDQLISVANPEVGQALAVAVHTQFFTVKLLPQLTQLSESGTIVGTTYVTKFLRTICSPALLKEFCFFLLGSDRDLEQRDGSGHALTKRLLERCNHLSEEVCIATLKLFDTLLQKEEEHIYHCLLLRNLLSRGYLRKKTPPPDSGVLSLGSGQLLSEPQNPLKDEGSSIPDSNTLTSHNVSDSEANGNLEMNMVDKQSEVAEREGSAVTQLTNDMADAKVSDVTHSPSDDTSDSKLPSESQQCKEDSDGVNSSNTTESSETSSVTSSSTSSQITSSPTTSSSSSDYLRSPVSGRSEVHKVVNCFLSLLPEEAKSSYQTADSGYDMYLRDAHRLFAIQETVCKPWNWPKTAVTLSEYATKPFYEGSFLHMLLEKLLHLLDQSYSVNLLLTALISKVVMIPHPNLHEFLLDPYLPMLEGTRTLHSVLLKITGEVRHHQQADAAFSQKLVLARKQLLGLVPTIHRLRAKSAVNQLPCDGGGFEDQARMEAVIVLEEFCKELSAIAFVKHHAAVTRF
ncbi:protein FAM160B1 isoform X2 [Aplysia californica]|uniref:Protein FAM160B1 isoform X2 n=2 Tax=Aplysia californica TaxID=6500 RepID=A0ABM1VQ46_APLCA|nr:protein FAM160B1 isoform X2 [Aplysia californica]